MPCSVKRKIGGKIYELRSVKKTKQEAREYAMWVRKGWKSSVRVIKCNRGYSVYERKK